MISGFTILAGALMGGLVQAGEPGFVHNQGQWDGPFLYRFSRSGVTLYASKDRFILDLLPGLTHHHHIKPFPESNQSNVVRGHALYFTIEGPAGGPGNPQGRGLLETYHNYFLGNDPSRWRSGVPLYREVAWTHTMAGFEIRLKPGPGILKYDVEVAPNGFLPVIRVDGAEKIRLKDSRLEIFTSVGTLEEFIPEAWQTDGSRKIPLKVSYKLQGNRIHFVLPPEYDPALPLTIDPQLVFSTYVGSGSDSWGFTATYDNLHNGYAGGIVFGSAYPLTPGAYQSTFGGNVDVCISKFNPAGSLQVFATFFGGNRPDFPYSMVVNSQNQLIVLGVTGSSNLPVTPGCSDNSFNGGNPLNYWQNGVSYLASFQNGADLFVAKFSANGQQLLGSTFVGGTGNDGINTAGGLNFNYADDFRGEVVVDHQDNILCISSTHSTDFPVVNAFDPTFNGVQDAVVFKLNTELTSLLWSTYFGGALADAGYGLKVRSNGEIYFCGGTRSLDLQGTGNSAQLSLAGDRDGFLACLSASGNALLAATYVGTPAYDQAYLLELDQHEHPCLLGQTLGAMGQVAGSSGIIYGYPNRGLFIRRYNADLSQVTLSTTLGTSPYTISIVPTAFLVDECNYFYIAGWAGEVNLNYNVTCSTTGLPVTSNAHQTTTDGSDFYFALFREDASSLYYATFFGGPNSHEHVDGGTSRFNKQGIIYQAICGGCGGYSDMYTTPGAWSSQNSSSNCNLALVKFRISDFFAAIQPVGFGYLCIGEAVQFINESVGATHFLWLFGDGTSSTLANPTHAYSQPGTYTVTLVAYNNDYCNGSDTATLEVTVLGLGGSTYATTDTLCPGESITLNASGGTSYQWLPAPGLNPSQMQHPSPSVTPTHTTTYVVLISSSCGTDSLHITVPVHNFQLTTSPNDTICIGSSCQLWASGAHTYLWQPPAGLSDPTAPNPIASPVITTAYAVTGTYYTCTLTDTVWVVVDQFPQAQIVPGDTVICYGHKLTLHASGGTHYSWQPSSIVHQSQGSMAVVLPLNSAQIILTASNACGQDNDTIQVTVNRVIAEAGPDTTVCLGQPVTLYATGGVRYRWEPSFYFEDNTVPNPTVHPQLNQIFWVWAYDSLNCSDADTVYIGFHPAPQLTLGPDRFIEFGGYTEIQAGTAPGLYQWHPPQGLSCTQCSLTVASPLYSTQYTVHFTDEHGCTFSDSLWVYVEGVLYIPNTFTPANNDGLNELFRPVFTDVVEMDLRIYNRWGQEIWRSSHLNDGWDGTYHGRPAPPGIYVWLLDYTLNSGRSFRRTGHVLLLR